MPFFSGNGLELGILEEEKNVRQAEGLAFLCDSRVQFPEDGFAALQG